MQFEMLKEKSSIIKVIGVGGGGGNAVNHMYRQGITGVDFIICNTDAQALELSPIPNKVQLGASLTEGMGAGSMPEVGKNSAIENIDDIKRMLGSNTKMLFITAGMGGGTGTGASPIIAKAAKELDILTVGIITTPFSFEGKRRKNQAEEGLEEFKKYVDSYLVISNDAAEGENRALRAVEGALASPLLKDNEIEGARYILLNISSGDKEVTMDEVSIITDFIQQEAGLAADLIWGNCSDEGLGEKISVTIIATGFQTKEEREVEKSQIRKVSLLTPELAPMVKPVQANSFMDLKKEEINEPVLKSTEESQVDLFAGYFHSAPKVEEEKSTESDYVRHTLTDEISLDFAHVEKSVEFEIETKEIEGAFEEVFEQAFDEPEQIVEDEIVAEVQEEEIIMAWNNPDEDKTDESIEEQLRKSKERILRLKDLSMKLRTTNGLQELENEPAYKRKQLSLNDVPHSSESEVSRFTLSNDEGITEIRPNNSFLHDNVD